MSEVFSVLLHNRQRYEQGKEGLWFSLPTTTEKLQAALREIGISTDNPQDFFLYGYRSPQKRPIKLPRDMVLSAGMVPQKAQAEAFRMIAGEFFPVGDCVKANNVRTAVRTGYDSAIQL